MSSAASWSYDPHDICLQCGGVTNIVRRDAIDDPHQESLVPSIDMALDASRTDPFDALPIQMGPLSKLLFDHFSHYHVLIRVPSLRNPANSSWASFTMADEGLMHASLVISASHYGLITGRRAQVNTAYYHHKAEAIKIINKKLSNPRLATNDTTISAVASLTISESFDGVPAVAKVHMDGLERLLEIRQKWESRELNGLLQRLIILADQLSAKVTGASKRFQLYGSNIIRLAIASENSRQESQQPTTMDYYDEDTMFNDLRDLTRQMQSTNKNLDNSDSSFIQQLDKVEQYLYDLVHEGRRPDGTTVDIRSSWKVCTVAGHLYLSLFLRDLPIESPILHYIVINLIDALELPAPTTLSGQKISPDVMLWMVIVGGTAAQKSKERQWFLKKLTTIRKSHKVMSWDVARELLHRCVWVDTSHEALSQRFWNETNG